MNRIIYRSMLLLCLLAVALRASAAPAEAEYRKVAKAWTLHADGSQEYRYTMELTLFTHTAMNNTYGESFIVYHPDYQELKIHASYTRQKDGTIVQTPANAFVPVLPAWAANAPAYNRLTEMVVVHTGLELGATIVLDYSIKSKPGFFPALDINEPLQADSPIKQCELSITWPNERPIAYQLVANDTPASRQIHGAQTTVRWRLHDLPASSREPFQPENREDMPRLIASTFASNSEALSILTERFNQSLSYESETFGPYWVEQVATTADKVSKLHAYVTDRMDQSRVPLRHTGYSIRDVDEALRSAYGTLAEKTQLLCVMLKAAGIPAEVVAVYPAHLEPAACGLSAIKNLAVRVTMDDGQVRYLSARQREIDEISARGDLDRVVRLDGTQAEVVAQPILAREEVAVEIAPEMVKKGTAICLLPTGTKGIDRWGLTALSSRRSQRFELPAALRQSVVYTITPPDGLELQNPTTPQAVHTSFGKVMRTIEPRGKQWVVTRTIELSKPQFSPTEYPELRRLIHAWIHPDQRLLLFTQHTD